MVTSASTVSPGRSAVAVFQPVSWRRDCPFAVGQRVAVERLAQRLAPLPARAAGRLAFHGLLVLAVVGPTKANRGGSGSYLASLPKAR